MFRLLHEIQGMQVVSLAEGRILGTVQKVFLNPQEKAVSGVLVREGGLSKDEGWVDIQQVEMIGEDVLFVVKAASFKAKSPVGRSIKSLMGMPVVSKNGKKLGSLVDVEIDQTWHVVELNLSEGLVEIDPKHAVFGQDTILLKAGAEKQVRKSPKKKKVGFMARVFGQEVIEEAADAISRAEKMPKVPEESPPKPKKAKKSSKKSSQ